MEFRMESNKNNFDLYFDHWNQKFWLRRAENWINAHFYEEAAHFYEILYCCSRDKKKFFVPKKGNRCPAEEFFAQTFSIFLSRFHDRFFLWPKFGVFSVPKRKFSHNACWVSVKSKRKSFSSNFDQNQTRLSMLSFLPSFPTIHDAGQPSSIDSFFSQ